MFATRVGDIPAQFNRLTSDGTILGLQKDGASVGILGVEGGNLVIDGSVSTGKSGIEFSGAEWLPRDAGANTNGVISLGDGSNRFKDLFLSGAAIAGTGGSSTPSFTFSGDTNTGLFKAADDTIGFTTGGTQRAAIDASGNLLVGKSVTTLNTTGLNVNGPDGRLEATASGKVAGIFNRTSSDGDILSLRKDGAVVGSIATLAGDFVVGSTSGSDAAFRMDGTNNQIYASNTSGAARDDAISLGASTVRWKDLYLSSGVYLGGTGSANLLDDYEEGSWTVNLHKGGSALAVTSRYGYYTRVGDLCFISFYWYNSSLTTPGSNVWGIRGMPFNVVALANGAYQFCPVGYNPLNSTNVHRWQANSSTELQMYAFATFP